MTPPATPKANGRARGPRVPLVAELPQPAPEPVASVIAAPTPQLDAAVFRVQAKAAKLIRNAPGQIQNRTYMYVTLTAVMDEVLPLLVEEDLLWRTFPTTLENGAPGLRYRMTHVPSHEFDEDTMPLPSDPTMQALGSGITYGRRYAIVAYLQLTIEEDDDGASANAQPPVDRYAQAEAAHAQRESAASQPTARPPQPSERRITANQREKLLKPRAQKAKLTDGEFANVILGAAGDPPREWRTAEHASQTLARLLDQLPSRLKDPVLEGIAQAEKVKKERSS